MTTIAYKDGVLAHDGLICAGRASVGKSFPKVFFVNKRVLCFDVKCIAIAGDSSSRHYLENEELTYKSEVPEHLSFNAMAITKCGRVIYIDSNEGDNYLHINVIDADYHAIGCGSDFALGAMMAGASPIESVRIASEFDTKTGGSIVSFNLNL